MRNPAQGALSAKLCIAAALLRRQRAMQVAGSSTLRQPSAVLIGHVNGEATPDRDLQGSAGPSREPREGRDERHGRVFFCPQGLPRPPGQPGPTGNIDPASLVAITAAGAEATTAAGEALASAAGAAASAVEATGTATAAAVSEAAAKVAEDACGTAKADCLAS